MENIAETLKVKRLELGLSKSELGRRLDVSSQLIGHYEAGKSKPKPDFYVKWKKVFGFDLFADALSVPHFDLSRVGSNLKALRLSRDIDLFHLTNAVYISQANLLKIESGQYFPEFADLQALASYFFITVNDLVNSNLAAAFSQENISVCLKELKRIKKRNGLTDQMFADLLNIEVDEFLKIQEGIIDDKYNIFRIERFFKCSILALKKVDVISGRVRVYRGASEYDDDEMFYRVGVSVKDRQSVDFDTNGMSYRDIRRNLDLTMWGVSFLTDISVEKVSRFENSKLDVSDIDYEGLRTFYLKKKSSPHFLFEEIPDRYTIEYISNLLKAEIADSRESLEDFAKKNLFDEEVLGEILNGDVQVKFPETLTVIDWLVDRVFAREYGILRKSSGGDELMVSAKNYIEVPFITYFTIDLNYVEMFKKSSYTELPKMVIPRPVEDGNYILYRVEGGEMNDGSPKSFYSGDVVLCKELEKDLWANKLFHEKYPFVVIETNGIWFGKLALFDLEHNLGVIDGTNVSWGVKRFRVEDVIKLYYVKKLVDRVVNIL